MDTQIEKPAGSERLLSLDALRGFDMFLIIGGGAAVREFIKALDHEKLNALLPQFEHVEWAGFTFWDLIMPLFLFIVGTAMPFSFGKRLARGDGKIRILGHVLLRSLILFILGMIAQGHLLEYDLSKLHIFCNTLQAIAVGYLIASIIILSARLLPQIITTAALLLLFWGLMMLIPVPGHGRGTLEPEVNVALALDRFVLGPYEDGTTYTWILSSITFTCTVMLGVFAGQLLRSDKPPGVKFLLLMALGTGCAGLALAWHSWFPIVKHVWTSSMVLFAGGLSYLLLAVFYLVIDVIGLRRWAFGFVVIGINAIFAYMFASLWIHGRIASIFVGRLDDVLGKWNECVQSLTMFLILWGVLFYMYRNKTFVKI